MDKTINQSVLLVEDEPLLSQLYVEYLSEEPYDITAVETGKEALALIDSGTIDAVILDLNLPDIHGMEILKHIQQTAPHLSVVVVTAHGSINTAVEAMQLGAADFLLKPFDPERFVYTLRNTFELQQLSQIVKTYKEEFDRREYEGFIGSSLSMQAVYKTIDAAGPSKASVFITGESGTGKEVCAEAVHAKSDRRVRPFIALNCAAIPKDLMESEIFGHVKGAFTGAHTERDGAAAMADGGTLFLDEICEMDPSLQAKLLRFLQTGTFQKLGSSVTEKVDVRFICATNKDPRAEVEAGNFREDLYFRLHVVPIHLPPLRERDGDILEIAEIFVQSYAEEEGKKFREISTDARSALLNYRWSGNVRELQNVLRNAIVLNDGETLEASMISAVGSPTFPSTHNNGTGEHANVASAPGPARGGSGGDEVSGNGGIKPLWQIEQDHINRALDAADGNVARAAALLEIGASTLYRRLKEMGHA